MNPRWEDGNAPDAEKNLDLIKDQHLQWQIMV